MTRTDKLRERFLDHGFQQHSRAMLIEEQKMWINARLNRKFTQEARTEAMNGGDHSTIKRALVTEPTPLVTGRGGFQNQIELFSKTLAHLVGRAVSKGDSDDLIDIEVVFTEDVQITLNEDGG